MEIFRRKASGITYVEIVIVLAVAGILAFLIYPSLAAELFKGNILRVSNDFRQVHLATMSMAVDAAEEGSAAKGWPGDMKARGVIHNTADFANLLVRGNYLRPEDLRAFCEGTDFKPYKGTFTSGNGGVLVPPFSEENNVFKIFLVKESDDSRAVFMETKNYTYGKALDDPHAKPFGDKGFVVGHKAGDVGVFKQPQAQNVEVLGKLPGGGTVESAENCLNPGAAKP